MRKTAKKLLSLLCAAVMLCMLLPVSALAAQPADWTVDTDTKTVAIHTATGLREWADSITTDKTSYDGYTISIEDNIDLSGKLWTSIIQLSGTVTIDGNGHTISNMTINDQGNDPVKGNTYLGFIGDIGYTTHLTVQNITFENAHVQDLNGDLQYSWCGVVLGHGPMSKCNTECTFKNVSIINSVVTGGHNNGAIMGYSWSSETGSHLFENCRVIDTFVGGYKSTSGILFGMGIANVTVRNCYASGVRLYSDGLNFNCCQSRDGSLWIGHNYEHSSNSDYQHGQIATVEDNNTAEDTFVVYPVYYHYADGVVKEYVQVNAPLSGNWYADEAYTQSVEQIVADLDGNADMYPYGDTKSDDPHYGNPNLVNDEAYETQNIIRVANPLTHGAIDLYTTASQPQKTSDPSMNKTIVLENGTEVDNTSAAAGDTINFKLTTTVPEDLQKYITYPADRPSVYALGTLDYTLTIHDQMAPKLELNKNSFQVKVGGTELDSKYYTVLTDAEDITDGCTFEVWVNLGAMYTDDVITEKDLGIAEITVTYTAKLSENAPAGTYKNTAWVDESAKDTVKVNTYGIKIFKYDQADSTKGLAGAEFELRDSDNHLIATLTSSADGYVTREGLDEGTYTLTETKAPNGYVKSDTPLTIVIPNNTDSTNIANVKFANTKIPSTGGMGTTLFTVGGGVLIAAAGALLVLSRKKKEKD